MRCDDCGSDFATAQALGSHRRWRHSRGHAATDVGETDPAALLVAGVVDLPAAVGRTIDALLAAGTLEEPVDAGRIGAMRALAVTVAFDPRNAQMWRELREHLDAVRAVDQAGTDELSQALEALRGTTSVGDTSAA